MQCRKCEGQIEAGWALVPQGYWSVLADFPGDYQGSDPSKFQRGQTVTFSPVGPADIFEVHKCKDCGHSFTLGRVPEYDDHHCVVCGTNRNVRNYICKTCLDWGEKIGIVW